MSVIYENTNNPDAGCGSNCSLKEVSSQDLRLDVEYINELQSPIQAFSFVLSKNT